MFKNVTNRPMTFTEMEQKLKGATSTYSYLGGRLIIFADDSSTDLFKFASYYNEIVRDKFHKNDLDLDERVTGFSVGTELQKLLKNADQKWASEAFKITRYIVEFCSFFLSWFDSRAGIEADLENSLLCLTHCSVDEFIGFTGRDPLPQEKSFVLNGTPFYQIPQSTS